MTRVACYSSFNYGYLSRARILAKTLKRLHPDWDLWAMVVDREPADLPGDALAGFDHILEARSLGVPDFAAWMFKHDVVEACTAVKGHMMAWLLDPPDGSPGYDKVIYLDPDIGVFNPLDGILKRLDHGSVVLTPHQTEPNSTELAVIDNEMTSLQYGIFNLGFVAARRDRTGRAFAAWWASMLYRACYDAPERGIFTDQKYCDLVPALFDRVVVERDPGYNVASWNLSRRTLRFGMDGGLRANGSPLKFYHFTKIGKIGDAMTQRYARDNVEVYELVNWYKRELLLQTVPEADRHKWAYGSFSDGTPIPKPARVLYRERRDLKAAFPDPFDTRRGGYLAWLRAETDIMPALADA
ncbi:MAG TPA: hypothetical protein VL154_01050 [Acetobacteraceae bacterium]|jgi:hypothetical protein|nr:hypothetical protein [Acetobacteraceae bacterium]